MRVGFILGALLPLVALACGSPVGDEPEIDPDDLKLDGLVVGTSLSTGEPVCSGDLAAGTFRYGLCVCGDLTMAGHLESSSYSSVDPGAGEGTGGGIGTNGSYLSAGNAEIGGTLSVAGDYGPVGAADIAGELRVGGDLRAIGSAEVALDAYVVGDVDSIGLEVAGTLHLTSEQSLPSFFVDAEATVVEDFAIAAPCGCDLAGDIVAFIAEAEAENDNDSIGLDPGALDGFAGDEDLELPAGRYYLDRIRAAGDIHLVITGPAALYVGGDVDLAGHLEVEMATEEATLDLFLGGDLAGAGSFEIGTAEAAAKVRVYAAGEGDLRVAGNLDLGSSVYAPAASLTTAGDVELFGAMVVGEVHNAGTLRMRYDAAVLDPGEGCAPPDDDVDDPGQQPGDDVPGDDEPGDDQPGDDDPGAECETFMDCPDPLLCVQGSCVYIDG